MVTCFSSWLIELALVGAGAVVVPARGGSADLLAQALQPHRTRIGQLDPLQVVRLDPLQVLRHDPSQVLQLDLMQVATPDHPAVTQSNSTGKTTGLKAGFGRADITPPPGYGLQGYSLAGDTAPGKLGQRRGEGLCRRLRELAACDAPQPRIGSH